MSQQAPGASDAGCSNNGPRIVHIILGFIVVASAGVGALVLAMAAISDGLAGL